MCNDFGKLIGEHSFELYMLIEKGLSKSVIKDGLSCKSKQLLIKEYFKHISNLIVNIGYLGLNYDSENIKYYVNTTLETFKKNYHKDILKLNICPQIIYLFSILQKEIEEQTFIEIINKLNNIDDIFLLIKEIFDDLYDLAEIAILNLSGLRLNCFNINENIKNELNETNSLFTKDMINHKCPSKELEDTCNGEECIHLFIHEKYYKSIGWLDKFINILLKYHTNPKNILMIIDYKLVNYLKWNDINSKRYQTIVDNLFDVYIINYQNIDFGKHKIPLLNPNEVVECS